MRTMKQSTRTKDEELTDVYEFRDEDNPEQFNRWSDIYSQFDNPNSYDGIYKYQFLQQNSSGLVDQIKEVPTITLDDDDDDYSAAPLDSRHKAGCEEVSEDFYATSDGVLGQSCDFTGNSADEKLLSPCMQMRVSTPLRCLPENGHDNFLIPESPCCDGVVTFGDLDCNGRVQESIPSTPDYELEGKYDPIAVQAHGQSVGCSEMGVMDTISIHTDYVAYGDKYFPASLILISSDSVKLKASPLEEGSAASCSEWKVDDILRIEAQWISSTNIAKVRIRLLRDVTHAEVANSTPGYEFVEFVVPNWSQQQERIMSLDGRYNAMLSMGFNMKSCDGDAVPSEDSECSSDPYIPSFEEPFEEVIYPKGEIDAVSVRKRDVDLLQPGVFINDTIIDFYITYLKNEIPHERRHNFHFFSSFFFRKLADLDKNPSSVSVGKAAFQRIRRWTRKVNIFEKDYIFIPVNYNLHWSLIVLCHPGEVANFNDENVEEALKVPCILHMDSIRGSHTGLKDLLQSYLLEEWKERTEVASEDVSSKFLNLRFLSLELPQQENSYDCGLFLLHYAELFIDEAPLSFSPFRINKFDYFLKQDWFVPAEASLKRVHIQRLIHELLKSRTHESVSPARNNLSHPPISPVNKEEDDNGIEIVSENRSPKKSWNGSSLYSELVQDLDISRLDMPLYNKPSSCVDSPGLGMNDLLEHCERYNQGASLEQLGFSITSIREVEGDEHPAHSNSGQAGLQPIDRVGEPHIGFSSEDYDQSFQWNNDLADQGDLDDTSSSGTSSSDTRSYDDSDEETNIQNVDSCPFENMDQLKEIVDSQEDYASASSDMMETPPEDSQELVELSHEDSDINEDEVAVSGDHEKLTVEDRKVEDNAIVADTDDKWMIEDSPPDQLRPAKRLRR